LYLGIPLGMPSLCATPRYELSRLITILQSGI
jgi:hypothetical protein